MAYKKNLGFKKGERVRVIEGDGYLRNHIGEIGKITNLSEGYWYDVEFANGSQATVSCSDHHQDKITRVTQKDMENSPIEVGSEVIDQKNRIGKIVGIYEGGVYRGDGDTSGRDYKYVVAYEDQTFDYWKEGQVKNYIAPEEMTMEQVCKELGRDVKIIKG